MRKRVAMIKIVILSLVVLIGHPDPATSESAIDPFVGTWRINVERSYALGLADENLPEQNPNALRQHVELRARICELTVSDSLIAFSRGRFTVEMSYEIREQEENSITVDVVSETSSATWQITLEEGRYLRLLSTATRFDDFYVYERGSIPRTEDGLPVMPPPPGRRPAPAPTPTPQPSPDDSN